MIKVKEKNGKQYIYQYDTGREVIITPEEGYTVDSIEYFNNTTDLAPIGIIREVDGVLLSDIPNSFLQSANAIQVYLVTHDEEGRQTIEYKDITVVPRVKPADYVLEPDAVLTWHSLDERLKILEEGGADGGMNKEQLQEAVNTAIAQAKESGEFDGTDGITPHIGTNGNWFIGENDTGNPSHGENGKTPVKGTDYFTEADKKEITEQVAESVGIPETLPNPNSLTFTGAVDAVYDGSEEIQIPITDDVQQRQIVKAVDYLFQDEDRGIMQHSFSVEEYPDLKKCKGNLIFIFESLGTTVKTFDGWIDVRFTLGDVIFTKTLSSNPDTFYTHVSHLFFRNNAYHAEATDNVNKYRLIGNNRAVNALSIPITELYTIPYDDEANVKIKKLDFEKLTKVDIYGYKETSFTNVKRFKLLVF